MRCSRSRHPVIRIPIPYNACTSGMFTSVFQFYPTVGYMNSGAGYPWYGMTVGDTSGIYDDFSTLTGAPSKA